LKFEVKATLNRIFSNFESEETIALTGYQEYGATLVYI